MKSQETKLRIAKNICMVAFIFVVIFIIIYVNSLISDLIDMGVSLDAPAIIFLLVLIFFFAGTMILLFAKKGLRKKKIYFFTCTLFIFFVLTSVYELCTITTGLMIAATILTTVSVFFMLPMFLGKTKSPIHKYTTFATFIGILAIATIIIVEFIMGLQSPEISMIIYIIPMVLIAFIVHLCMDSVFFSSFIEEHPNIHIAPKKRRLDTILVFAIFGAFIAFVFILDFLFYYYG